MDLFANYIRDYQGVEIENLSQIKFTSEGELQASQLAYSQKALAEGINAISRSEKSQPKLNSRVIWHEIDTALETGLPTDPYEQGILFIRAAFEKLRSLVNYDNGVPQIKPQALIDLLDIVERKHYIPFLDNSDISEYQKHSLELLTGLLYVEASGITSIEDLNALIQGDVLDNSDASRVLSECSKLFSDASPKVMQGLGDKVEAFLSICEVLNSVDANDYFGSLKEHLSPKQVELMKRLVDLRAAPVGAEPLIVGAQAHHWNGLGGGGVSLSLNEGAVAKSDQEALNQLSKLSIAYHGEFEGTSFNKLKIFQELLTGVRSNMSTTVANWISEKFSTVANLKIKDLATGNGTTFIRIANALKNISDQTINVTASEMAGGMIQGLLDKGEAPADFAPNISDFSLFFEDLATIEPQDVESQHGKYHAVTISLALHQIVGDRWGVSRLRNAVKTMNSTLVEGGILGISRVDRNGAYQRGLLPANQMDREGNVPSIYDVGLFSDYAVKVESGNTPGQDRFAILVPITDLHRSFPEALGEHGIYANDYYEQRIISGDELIRLSRSQINSKI